MIKFVFIFFLIPSWSWSAGSTAVEFSAGPSLVRLYVNQRISTPVSIFAQAGVFFPFGATTDWGIRAKSVTSVNSTSGVGAGIESIFRWFPFTFSRSPVFESGPVKLTYTYRLMPYIGSGLSIAMQAVDRPDLQRVLAIYPRLPILIGSYLPIKNGKWGFNFEASAVAGNNFSTGSFSIEEYSASVFVGVVLFL